MIYIKNNLIYIFSIVFTLNTFFLYPVEAIEKKNSDMFSILKSYAETSSKPLKEEIIIVEKGDSLDSIVSKKVDEKYSIALQNKENMSSNENNSEIEDNNTSSDNSSNNSQNNSNTADKYPNQNSYFAGTVDFTNLLNSKQDANLNDWSAINKNYDKYDDGGLDNVTIIATAYTSAAEENGGYAGMNAIGGKLGPGCIAAPKDIPFQTKIRISGLGVFNVEDRGGAIVRVSDNIIRIDVWMDSYKEAMKFGKRVYKGRIL